MTDCTHKTAICVSECIVESLYITKVLLYIKFPTNCFSLFLQLLCKTFQLFWTTSTNLKFVELFYILSELIQEASWFTYKQAPPSLRMIVVVTDLLQPLPITSPPSQHPWPDYHTNILKGFSQVCLAPPPLWPCGASDTLVCEHQASSQTPHKGEGRNGVEVGLLLRRSGQQSPGIYEPGNHPTSHTTP